MLTAPFPLHEQQRLQCLQTLQILDTPPDPALDALAALASRLLGCPIALLSLVDAERQWFKARVGLDLPETPRELAICAHTILGDDLLVVPDALQDPRFADNPLVTGPTRLRFYAGMPLRVDGHALGTLCVADREPHQWTEVQAHTLQDLAQAAQGILQREMRWRQAAVGQARLADFAAASSDFLWECDAALQLVWCSPQASAWLGGALLDGPLLDPLDPLRPLGHPHSPAPTLHQAMAAEVQPFTRRLVQVGGAGAGQDASGKVLSLSAQPVHGRQGEHLGWRGSARDITTTVTAQRQLREQDERLRLIARHVPGALYEFEQTPDGWSRFPFASAGLKDVLGLAPEALRDDARAWMQRVHPEDQARLARALQRSAQALQPLREEFRVCWPDGVTRWVECHASPRSERPGHTLWHGWMADVSQRRTALRALTEARTRLGMAMAAAQLGTLVVDTGARSVTLDSNARAAHGLGPGVASLTLDEWVGCMAPPDRARLHDALRDAARGQPAQGLVLQLQQPGRHLSLLVAGPRQAGQLLAICRDATTEEQARAARQAAELAERRRVEHTEFLSRVSHELRTPLNAILGFSQLLLTETAAQLAPPHRHWLDHVRRGGQHLLALIEDVLSLSRADTGQLRLAPEPLALVQVVRDSAEFLAPLADAAGQAFELPPPDDLLLVQADRRALRQVLVNLLDNAIKYNRAGAQVRVRCERQAQQCVVHVCDQGPGIAPEALKRLFMPFERLGAEHSEVPGTGLGLAIAQHLVQAMGGWIDAHCPPEGGTCVRFALPVATPAAVPGGPVAGPAPGVAAPGNPMGGPMPGYPPGGAAPGATTRQALYVEDNEVNALLMQAIFQHEPTWQLRVCQDVPQALQQLQGPAPQLLLVDLTLPGQSGLDLVQQVRSRPALADVRCVAVTADAQPETRQAAHRAGFDDFWTKPVDARAIRGWLAQWAVAP